MKLTGNIFPPVSNLMGSNTNHAMKPVSSPGQGVFEFHSLIKGQVKLELFQEESIPPGSPEIYQNDWNEGKEPKGEELDLKFDMTNLPDIQVTENADLFSLSTSNSAMSDVPLPVPVQVGFERMSEPVSASNSVQIQKPQLAKSSGLPLLLQAETGQPIKSFVGSNQLESDRPFSANNTAAELKTEPAPTKFESNAPRENRALAISVSKDQPAHLAIDKEEANAVINRAVEQKSVVAPATIIITKAIVQNFQTQRADASQNILNVLAPDSPRSFQSIEVQLVPKNLGIVEVKIRHSNRHLGIVIETKTKEAESLLRSEIAAISKSLVAAGLSMDEITIRFNPRLEQNDLRDLRFVDTPPDKSVSESFNSDINQQSREELDKKSKYQSQISNKNSESDQRISSNSGRRRGIYM